MRKKLSGAAPIVANTLVAITLVAITLVATGAAVLTPVSPASAQASATPGAPAPSLKTPWGEPDLQGIWTDETDTPLQRPPKLRGPPLIHRFARFGSVEEVTAAIAVQRAK